MQERGERSTQPQQQQGWAPSYEQQPTEQFPQPARWDPNAQYAAPAPSHGRSQPAPGAKSRPRWKTPLIAVVALVVGIAIGAAAGGSKSNSPSANAGTTSTSSIAPSAAAQQPVATAPAKPAAAPAAPATAVVLTLSGNGTKTTKNFTIAKGDWSLKYSYTCSDGEGAFQVYEDYPDGTILANELGSKGDQTTYQHGDSGRHSLMVNSTCAWTLTATDGDGG